MAERRIGDVKVRLTKLFSKGDPPEVQGSVTSNLIYILPLEYGHSGQAPSGMLRPNLRRIGALARGELQHSLAVLDDPTEALLMAVTGATSAALAVIVEATPVDKGAARLSWRARYPGGGP